MQASEIMKIIETPAIVSPNAVDPFLMQRPTMNKISPIIMMNSNTIEYISVAVTHIDVITRDYLLSVS